ncbi:UNVERIFIED_CONTAM: hypothetical protein HDU68_006365 [Siphonaria sp. JEL0065]|nr:hypothetical protein HDU68_006365 [Siphonaria sp. JEL0065]
MTPRSKPLSIQTDAPILRSIEAEIEYWKTQRFISGDPVTPSMGRRMSTSDISALMKLASLSFQLSPLGLYSTYISLPSQSMQYDTVSRQTHERCDAPPPAPPKESPPPPPPPRSLLFDHPDSYSLEFNPFYTLNTLSLDRNAKSEYLHERNQQHTAINTQKPLPPNPPRHSSRRPQLYSPQFIDEFSGFPPSFPAFIDESSEFGNLDTMRNYDYTSTNQDFVFPIVGQGEAPQETSSNNSTKATTTTTTASTTSRLGGGASSGIMRKKGSCMELRDLYHLHAEDDQEKRVAMEVSMRRAELLELQGLQEAMRMRKQSLRRSVSYTFLQQRSGYSYGDGFNQSGVGSNGSNGGNLSSFMESRQSQYHHQQQQDARNTKKKSGFVGWFKDVFAKKKSVDRSTGQTGIKSPTIVERVGVAMTLRRNKSPPVSTYNSMLINPVPGGLAIAGVDEDDEEEIGTFGFDD